ncbi:hypothetical protein CGCF415_v008732 [Colletotrichum fructicola]|uniref:HAUS augmin-like complex subunit 1 n=1 Tax=Colletotrichum fructicola (strain Nara gc5) TaxID=1213859 RepID=L2FF88_COLFN|nr:uncharacterized protein CGMCC3_g15754 [Colletotrichum fructicola]KAF4477828.1 hypothetical protein CGGC5_v013857 [Colletotrichum fructicola Nara gc5]KAI8275234.1 hypothetical protein K4K60_008815 [Colletotrichum sp. SAR11_57]KAE9568081.1 hypothetical protein CGMCC3_g15754 [Colletotrichum fructicola]KAF4413976.1 hypothetical protein CFRS1_v008690 [Colletotrichum fructicola]KAF4882454.1 hypothetical protein CGCFRS4_v014532 [Colletotrichum fructicola]
MSHLPPSTAIFSPSIARIAASTAKDWNYVDCWLTAKFHGRAVPPFERNPETLKALLALASLNETADEERELVSRAEAAALHQISEACHEPEARLSELPLTATVRERILTAVQDHLTREGSTALNSMATLSCQLSVAYPDAETLGRSMINLHARASELEQMRVRVHILLKYIEQESTTADELLQTLRSDDYKPTNDLARQNLDMQRRIKAMAARLPELKDRISSANQSHISDQPAIEQIIQEESNYLELLAQKRGLDAHVTQFSSLPDDVQRARLQLENLRTDLRAIIRRRDTVFEGLVERESPRKDR